MRADCAATRSVSGLSARSIWLVEALHQYQKDYDRYRQQHHGVLHPSID